MTQNQKQKGRKLQRLPHMIAAVMTHVTTVFAAMMLAADKRGKWFPEISNLRGAGGLVLVN
jgi:hypothetical protein